MSTYIAIEWQFTGKMYGKIPLYSTLRSKAVPNAFDGFDVFGVARRQPQFFADRADEIGHTFTFTEAVFPPYSLIDQVFGKDDGWVAGQKVEEFELQGR